MIYRVQFKRDGSVSSCRAVESHLENGGLIVYIEAKDATEAIAKAKRAFGSFNARRKEEAIKRGDCEQCLKRPAFGKKVCKSCIARTSRNRRQRRALEAGHDEQAMADRKAKIAAARRENVLRLVEKSAQASLAKSNALWDAGSVPRHHRVKATLLQCLRAYDRSPEAFRDWLIARIDRYNEATAAE